MTRTFFRRFALVCAAALLIVPLAVRAQEATATPIPTPPFERADGRLILATTTSTYDSGLLDAILPDFTAQTGITVDVISVGSGQAFEIGRAGNADVLLVHDRRREDTFVAEGFADARADVMFNDFVVVGPASDPAGIAGLESVTEAFTQLAAAGTAGAAAFVSRGDDSGTHSRELRVWEAAELTPDGDWYISAGQGMGAVLNMANELQAYTLADRGTYAARLAEGLDLAVLVEGDPLLLNPYGVLAVSAERFPVVNAEGAALFVDWLLSVETQALIGAFTVNDNVLFTPSSAAWLAAQAEATPEVTPEATPSA